MNLFFRKVILMSLCFCKRFVGILLNLVNPFCSLALFRIDEIHQQLEEQLSVLAHFIDGVANLRPKGTNLGLPAFCPTSK